MTIPSLRVVHDRGQVALICIYTCELGRDNECIVEIDGDRGVELVSRGLLIAVEASPADVKAELVFRGGADGNVLEESRHAVDAIGGAVAVGIEPPGVAIKIGKEIVSGEEAWSEQELESHRYMLTLTRNGFLPTHLRS